MAASRDEISESTPLRAEKPKPLRFPNRFSHLSEKPGAPPRLRVQNRAGLSAFRATQEGKDRLEFRLFCPERSFHLDFSSNQAAEKEGPADGRT